MIQGGSYAFFQKFGHRILKHTLIHMTHYLVGQTGVKNNHKTAFCDEDLKFGTVAEETKKSKTGYRAKYYRK